MNTLSTENARHDLASTLRVRWDENDYDHSGASACAARRTQQRLAQLQAKQISEQQAVQRHVNCLTDRFACAVRAA